MSMLKVVGQRVPKADAPGKVTGDSRYVDDLSLPRMLYARLTRSQVDHGRVCRVDVADALDVPGVAAVLSSENIAEAVGELNPYDPACHDFERDTPFAPVGGDARVLGPVVRYMGEPVAVVAAETDEAALRAAALVDVQCDPLPALHDPSTAQADGAPLVHDNVPGNIAARVHRAAGDVDRTLASASVVVERQFATSRQKQAQLEPSCCLVEPTPGGGFVVHTPAQAPHRARFTLANIFGVSSSRIRVVNPVIGGAFGKGDALTAEPYAVALALATGRPVKLRFSRNDDFVGTEIRHPSVTDVTAGFDDRGRLIALRATTTLDAGAYLSHSPRIAAVLAGQFTRVYPLADYDVSVNVVFTNNPVSGAFRGYGGPQAAFPLEQTIDLGARAVGVDPVTARRGMLAGVEGKEALLDCVETAAREIDPTSPPEQPDEPHRRRGVGLACVSWKSGVADKPGAVDQSGAAVHVNADGSVEVASAACDLGTGIKTTLAQICAEVLGFDVDAVRVTESDTGTTPFDSGAFASRSLYRAGQAVHAAALDAKSRILAFAARELEADPADLDLTDGEVRIRGAASRSVRLESLLHQALFDGHDFHGYGQAPATSAPSAAAQVAEVEVDTRTGQVRVLRLVAVQDVGRAVNPTIVEGQIEGAAHQGLGYALAEELVLDEATGGVMNGSYMDYRLLTSADGPLVETRLLEHRDGTGPFGAKGVGEPGIILPAPTIANAIRDAVGVTPTMNPMTPERVFRALDQHARTGS